MKYTFAKASSIKAIIHLTERAVSAVALRVCRLSRHLRQSRARSPLRRWELALVLAVGVTLCQGLVGSGVQVGWWGVIFPGLSPQPSPAEEAVEAVSLDAGSGVTVRFWLLDWLEGLWE